MSHSTACVHCGDTDDHVHLDSAEHARSRRRALLYAVAVRAVTVVAAVLAILLALPAPAALAGLAAGVALWALSTAAGVLTAALLASRLGRIRALMLGALLAAALTPALGAIAARMDPMVWTFAATIAVGYLAGAFAAEAVRLWRLRALLAQDTREGEVARDSAALTRDQDRDLADLAATALMAVLAGGYVWATGVLPLLVLVLVPLHVAIVALLRRTAVRQPLHRRVELGQRADS